MTQPKNPLDFITEQYRMHYTAPTTSVTLTFTSISKNTNSTFTLQIEPYGFASISTLYRTIPKPENDNFEINELNWLETKHDVRCFLNMCRNSIPTLCNNKDLEEALDPEHYTTWCTHKAFYAASRLCDHLGIEAASVLGAYKGFLVPFGYGLHKGLERKVLFHQIALKFKNAAGLKDIPILLANAHIRESNLSSIASDETQILNHRTLVMQLLYHKFSENAHLAAHKPFLVEKLGWHVGENIHFGYRIVLS